MRFLIHGFYGAGNTGDDAILHAIIDRIASICPEFKVTVTVRSQIIIPYYGPYDITKVSGFDLNLLHHAVSKSDMVIVGGGGLFQDYAGFSALQLFQGAPSALRQQGAINYYSAPIFLAKTLGKPVFLYALGIGPFQSEEAKRAAGWIAGLADAITVRDQASLAILQGLGVHRTILAADPAVRLGSLHTSVVEPKELIIYTTNHSQLKIAFNLRKWVYGKEESVRAYDAMVFVAQQLISKYDALLFILPFNRSKVEVSQAEEFASLLPHGAVEIIPYEGSSPVDVKFFLGEMDLVIAERLHASILAMSAGTPAIGLSYDPKVIQFFEEIGLPELCHTIEEVTPESLLATAELVLLSRSDWSSRIKENLVSLQQRDDLHDGLLRDQLVQIMRKDTNG